MHEYESMAGKRSFLIPPFFIYIYISQFEKKKEEIDLPCLEQRWGGSRVHLLIPEEEAVTFCFFFKKIDGISSKGQLIEVCLKTPNVPGSYYHEDQSLSGGGFFVFESSKSPRRCYSIHQELSQVVWLNQLSQWECKFTYKKGLLSLFFLISSLPSFPSFPPGSSLTSSSATHSFKHPRSPKPASSCASLTSYQPPLGLCQASQQPRRLSLSSNGTWSRHLRYTRVCRRNSFSLDRRLFCRRIESSASRLRMMSLLLQLLMMGSSRLHQLSMIRSTWLQSVLVDRTWTWTLILVRLICKLDFTLSQNVFVLSLSACPNNTLSPSSLPHPPPNSKWKGIIDGWWYWDSF